MSERINNDSFNAMIPVNRIISREEERTMAIRRFWMNLEHLLSLRQKSMKWLTDQIGCSINTVRSNKYKLGEIRISFAVNVARVLGVSVSDLLYTELPGRENERDLPERKMSPTFFAELRKLSPVQTKAVALHMLAYFGLGEDDIKSVRDAEEAYDGKGENA